MSTIVALLLVLLGLLAAVGGKQGLGDFVALLLNMGIMIVATVLMAGGFQPVVVAVVAGLAVLATIIFLATPDSDVAGTAFTAALLAMGLVLLVVVVGVVLSHTAGFGQEDSEELEGFSLTIGISFQHLLIATGLLSTLGAIAEAAVAVAAGLAELGPTTAADARERLGSAIIGTALNTLFFGFFGGFAGLFIWFAQLHYPFWQILNDQIFAGELIQVFFSVIAVTLTVPLTIWVSQMRHQGGQA
ncbi:YibE/F family protein [Lacticaseibacillus daqingensis]|uniref:YibE/F family protein n=1 Tax=Lacticaseibacillus daqingensis TaxID=2486014 RepID=UPI000F7B92FE|nr:YibE/F family protein [Lacticaseibacillus daqingensis]